MRFRAPARPGSPRRLVPLALGLVLLLGGFQQYRGRRRAPYHEGLPTTNGAHDHAFTFCRLSYTSVTQEYLGTGWNTDYPGSDSNFMLRLSQLTPTHVTHWERTGEPGYAVVSATEDEIYECPFLFASDVGTVRFSELEVVRLRDYLAKGGFLYVDDFWGEAAWRRWSSEIGRVLPDLPIVDVQPDDVLMNALYRVPKVPQIPSIQFWRRSGRRSTSERGAETATPHFRAIFDAGGRAMVVMTHNTDIADGWEREGEDEDFFYNFSPESYAMGINIVLYAMSH